MDTSGYGHTLEYLTDVSNPAISSRTQRFNCHITSLVTDNATKVEKIRRQLQECEDLKIVIYCCSAHLFILLIKDVELRGVKDGTYR